MCVLGYSLIDSITQQNLSTIAVGNIFTNIILEYNNRSEKNLCSVLKKLQARKSCYKNKHLGTGYIKVAIPVATCDFHCFLYRTLTFSEINLLSLEAI